MAKLKMQNMKGIVDVNQSLALNPRLLQVIILITYLLNILQFYSPFPPIDNI